MYPRAQIDTELPGSIATVEVGAAAYLQDWLTWLGCEPGLMFQGYRYTSYNYLLHRAVYTLHSTYPCQRYIHISISVCLLGLSCLVAFGLHGFTYHKGSTILAQLVTILDCIVSSPAKREEPIGPLLHWLFIAFELRVWSTRYFIGLNSEH